MADWENSDKEIRSAINTTFRTLSTQMFNAISIRNRKGRGKLLKTAVFMHIFFFFQEKKLYSEILQQKKLFYPMFLDDSFPQCILYFRQKKLSLLFWEKEKIQVYN